MSATDRRHEEQRREALRPADRRRLYPLVDADASSTILRISARRLESSICRNALTSLRPSAADGASLALARPWRKADSTTSLASVIEDCSNRDIRGHRSKHARANKVGQRQAVVKTRCDMSPS